MEQTMSSLRTFLTLPYFTELSIGLWTELYLPYLKSGWLETAIFEHLPWIVLFPLPQSQAAVTN
jgi:hypothetical protein